MIDAIAARIKASGQPIDIAGIIGIDSRGNRYIERWPKDLGEKPSIAVLMSEQSEIDVIKASKKSDRDACIARLRSAAAKGYIDVDARQILADLCRLELERNGE
jgi:hypothetical protein